MTDARIAALERRIDMIERLLLERPPAAPITPRSLHDARGTIIPAFAPTTPADPAWIPVMHAMIRPQQGWPRPCGQVGLYLDRPIREGERCDLQRLRVLVPGESSWRTPTTEDTPRCSSCGELIDAFSSADLDYLSVMLPAGTAGDPPPGTPGSDRARPPSPPAATDINGTETARTVRKLLTSTPEAREIDRRMTEELMALSIEALGRHRGPEA
jgi:hypothetical protein